MNTRGENENESTPAPSKDATADLSAESTTESTSQSTNRSKSATGSTTESTTKTTSAPKSKSEPTTDINFWIFNIKNIPIMPVIKRIFTLEFLFGLVVGGVIVFYFMFYVLDTLMPAPEPQLVPDFIVRKGDNREWPLYLVEPGDTLHIELTSIEDNSIFWKLIPDDWGEIQGYKQGSKIVFQAPVGATSTDEAIITVCINTPQNQCPQGRWAVLYLSKK